MVRYLILETVERGNPKVVFYDRNSHKWREDRYYGDVKKVIQTGKKIKKFGLDVIKF